jgi:hypothetical protein
MKTDPGALGNAHKGPVAQNMKSSLDDLGTVENESGSAKHENGTRLPRYRQKCVRERKT